MSNAGSSIPYLPVKRSTDDVLREILELKRLKLQKEANQASFPDLRKIKVIIEEEGKNSVVFPFDFLTYYDEPEKVQAVLCAVAYQAVAAFAGVLRREAKLFDDDPGSAFNLSQRYEVSE